MEVKLESISDVGPQPSRPCRPDGNAACLRHVVSGSRPRVRPQLKNEGIFTIHAVAQNLCNSVSRKQALTLSAHHDHHGFTCLQKAESYCCDNQRTRTFLKTTGSFPPVFGH